MTDAVRIFMWSGPRNISTAMMRAFGSRPDCHVSDEPFYAHFLSTTGIDHPMRDAILTTMENDYELVVRALCGPVPVDRPLWYQKHMTHHMATTDDLTWVRDGRNAFLIRDPRSVVASYAKKRQNPTDFDIGIKRQVELFGVVSDLTGRRPPVVDAADVLSNPSRALAALCDSLDLAFDPAMLSWPPGRHPTDGVWAEHWYAAVEASTGFSPPTPPPEPMAHTLEALAAENQAAFDAMAHYKLEV